MSKVLLVENYPGLAECVKFHGHLCPGLALGYKASILAMSRLNETKAEDEEIVAIVENESCFVDAVQVITGCTFGKGNLIFRDYGKMVITLLSRKRHAGVRVGLGSSAFPFKEDKNGLDLMDKVFKGTATDEEKRQFQEFQLKRAKKILDLEAEEFFSVNHVSMDLPPFARIMRSEICDMCGEPVMITKLVEKTGKKVCKSCAG